MRRCVMMFGLYVGLHIFFNVRSMYIRVCLSVCVCVTLCGCGCGCGCRFGREMYVCKYTCVLMRGGVLQCEGVR